MRAEITGIQIEINRVEARNLRNQILKATDSKIEVSHDYIDTPLHSLFRLLSGSFEDSKRGVHFL